MLYSYSANLILGSLKKVCKSLVNMGNQLNGRALALQAGGSGFDSHRHHFYLHYNFCH